MLFLDKVDAAPIANSDFPFDFNQWLAVTVDVLNEVIADIQNVLMSTESVAGITQDVVANSTYIPTNVALTSFQLPDNFDVGSRVAIVGNGAGGWSLLTGAGQTIEVASQSASAAVSVTSASQYDSIEIIGVVANTTWVTVSGQTTAFVIV